MPEPELTVTTAVLLLLHVPPVVASESVAVLPVQRVVVPVIAEIEALTVTIFVAVALPQLLVTV